MCLILCYSIQRRGAIMPQRSTDNVPTFFLHFNLPFDDITGNSGVPEDHGHLAVLTDINMLSDYRNPCTSRERASRNGQTLYRHTLKTANNVLHIITLYINYRHNRSAKWCLAPTNDDAGSLKLYNCSHQHNGTQCNLKYIWLASNPHISDIKRTFHRLTLKVAQEAIEKVTPSFLEADNEQKTD